MSEAEPNQDLSTQTYMYNCSDIISYVVPVYSIMVDSAILCAFDYTLCVY